MDSSFESDPSNLNVLNENESDIDTQLLAEQQMTQYQETINDLRKQNTILKAQFEQAVIITKQIDNVHEKNAQLSNQVRSLQTDNENLQHRLEISLRHNEEVEDQLATEKAALAQQVIQASSEKEIEVSKAQKHCNGRIDTLLVRIKQLEDAKEQSDLQTKMLGSKIERVLQAAAECYNLSFDGIDSFTDFLHQPVEAAPLNEPKHSEGYGNSSTDANAHEKAEKAKQQNKEDKKKIKMLKRHCEKLVSEVNRLQSEISSAESRHQQEIKSYQTDMQQLKSDLSMTQSEHNDIIKTLKTKNQSLKCEVQKLRKETIQVAPIMPARPKSPIQTNSSFSPIQVNNNGQIDILRDENENLVQLNQELNNKIKAYEEAKTDMLLKVKAANDEKTKMQLTINRLESEKQTAVVIQNETINELKNVRERLRMKEELKPKQETKIVDKLKDEIMRLESTIQSQTDQIHNLQLQAENDRHEKSSAAMKLNAAQTDIEEMHQKILTLNDELAEANDKLHSKPEITVEDIMPDSAFRCKDFDPILTQKIEKVIGNQYLAPKSKLSRIYAVIIKFYSAIVEERNRSVQHMSEHLEKVKKKINKFFVDLSIGLAFNAVTFDDFVDRDPGQKLLDRAIESYKGYEEMKRKNAQLNSIVSQISSEFGHGVDFRAQVSSIRQQIEAQTQNARQTLKKYNELKRSNKNYKKSAKTKITNLEKQKLEMNETIHKLQAEIENLLSQNQDLKREIQVTKAELNSIKTSIEQSEEDIRDEHQQILDSVTQQHLAEKEQLQAQIDKMKSENQKARSILADNETSFSRMKKVLDQHQVELQAKDEEIVAYKNEKDNEIANLNAKFNTEKKQLQRTFDNAIAEIRRQCEDQRDDFTRISQELKQQREKNQQVLSKAAKMKREKQKLERDVKTLEEQIKRDQMITEASIKNQVMSVEENYSQQLQDARARTESEKRRIFTFAAEEFRKYFNPADNLDERSYKSLLNKIKKELERLTESDVKIRRLTGAVPRQATDEAVAKLVTP